MKKSPPPTRDWKMEHSPQAVDKVPILKKHSYTINYGHGKSGRKRSNGPKGISPVQGELRSDSSQGWVKNKKINRSEGPTEPPASESTRRISNPIELVHIRDDDFVNILLRREHSPKAIRHEWHAARTRANPMLKKENTSTRFNFSQPLSTSFQPRNREYDYGESKILPSVAQFGNAPQPGRTKNVVFSNKNGSKKSRHLQPLLALFQFFFNRFQPKTKTARTNIEDANEVQRMKRSCHRNWELQFPIWFVVNIWGKVGVI
jgi:hypothetical protein